MNTNLQATHKQIPNKAHPQPKNSRLSEIPDKRYI